MEIVNENSTHFVEVSFYDENNNPVVPSYMTYRVDDVFSNTNIIPPTQVVPSSSTYTIEIPPDKAVILNDENLYEIRKVTITYNYGSKQGTAEYRYKLKNLKSIV